MAEVKTIRLEDFIQRELGGGLDNLDILPRVIGGGVPIGLLTLAASLPKGVEKAGDLSSDPAEVARKKAERQAVLDEARRNKTSATVADKIRDAAERGEYGFNPIIVPDETVNKPKVEIFPELTEAEKLPTTTAGGVIDINDLISKPIGGGFIPEETFTDLIYTPIPEIEPFTILTMANKNKDTVKIGNKTYPIEQTEIKRRKTDKRPYRVVKEEFKDKDEIQRIADGKFVRETLPKYFEDNPTIKETLYTPRTSKELKEKELEKVREYFVNNHKIDFKTDTYEKIIRQTIGKKDNEKTGRKLTTYQTAEKQFEKNIKAYANDLGIKISGPQMDRYNQDFRIAIKLQNPDKKKGEPYSEEDIRGATNLIISTIMRNPDPYLKDFVKDKEQRIANTKANKEKNLDGIVETLGHTGSIAEGDVLFGEAANPERYMTESLDANRDKEVEMVKYRKAVKDNNTKEMNRIENKFKKLGLRAMYVDKDGFDVYIGADAPKGKLKDGGLVGISHLIRPLGNF